MSSVAEIEKALSVLPVEEVWKVADWLQQYLEDRWDDQIDDDIAAGRLDRFADKALADYHAGNVKPLDDDGCDAR